MIDHLSKIFQIAGQARAEADQIMSLDIQMATWDYGKTVPDPVDIQNPDAPNTGTVAAAAGNILEAGKPIDDRVKRYAIIKYCVEEMRKTLDDIDKEISDLPSA
jgi:hypothetical protein